MGVAALWSVAACGTKATGVEECRQIESARCRSAAQCGLIDDVAACERYVTDECRHGFAPNLGPSSSNVTSCVKALGDVEACAKRSGKKTAPGDCGRASLEAAKAENVCELVEHPEQIPRCSFLAKPSQTTNDDEDKDEHDAAAAPKPTEAAPATPPDAAADAAAG